MPHPVYITARAERDVEEAVTGLSGFSFQAASSWHAALLEKVQTLEEAPDRCPLAAEAERLGIELRELLFGKGRNVYRILFIVDGGTVNVHHIRHAARDWLQPGEL